MLIGECKIKLTEKNRIALPKKFRDKLEGDLYITRGYEGCLIILDSKRWVKLIKSIEVKPFLHRTVRDTKRFILGGAENIQLDSQGRFVLSETHKDYAGIKNEVVFIGISDWLEIWDKERWIDEFTDLKKSAEEIAEKLSSV